MHGVILLQQLLHAESVPGYVIGWGNNGGGQATGVSPFDFTNGVAIVTGTPWSTGTVTVAGQVLSNAASVTAGFFHGLALRTDGTVVGLGDNFLGQTFGDNLPDKGTRNGIVTITGRILSNLVSLVASRNFSLALKQDGTVVTWGENIVPEGLTNVAAVAAEWGKGWALKRDGTIVGWMSNPSSHGCGQLLPEKSVSNAVAIAVGPGGYFTLGVALLRDGTVANWGRKFEHPDANPPAGLSNVVAVAAGAGHSLALKNDGTVVGWGWNKDREATGEATSDMPNMDNFSSGPVRLHGQLLTNVVAIAAGHSYSMALKKDGTVVAWGKMGDSQRPATVPEGLSNVVAIAAGAEDFCLAITTNKAVADRFATGRN